MPPITASTDVAAALAHSRRRASLPPASDSPARVAQNRRTGGRGGMRRGSGGVPAWTPLSDPDTVLWLDAALSPRTESTGAIDQWNDLSPTGAHASATLTTRPTHDATAIGGSYPGIVFDGVNDFMTCTAGTLGAALSGRSGITIFSVWVDTTVAARYLLEYGANGGTTLAGSFATLLNITNANSSSTYARGNIGSNIWRSNVGTEDFVTPKIFTQSIDFTAAAASEVGAARINGSAIAGAQVGASENTSTFTSQILAIGAQVSGASPIAGKLGVLIIVGRAMTDADKLVFERYLGGRFGLPFSDVMAARAAIQTPRILWLGQSNAMGQLDAYTTIERWDGPHVKPSILAYKDFYSAAWFTSTWGGLTESPGLLWEGPDLVAAIESVRPQPGGIAPEVIFCAQGSTSLATEWAPGGSTYVRLTGTTYPTAISTHPSAPANPTPFIVWIQGESDAASAPSAAAYSANLPAMFTQLGVDLPLYASAKIVVVQLHINSRNGAANATTVGQVRAGQQAFVAASPTTRRLIDIDDLPLQGDVVHFTEATAITVGKRIAAALVALQ